MTGNSDPSASQFDTSVSTSGKFSEIVTKIHWIYEESMSLRQCDWPYYVREFNLYMTGRVYSWNSVMIFSCPWGRKTYTSSTSKRRSDIWHCCTFPKSLSTVHPLKIPSYHWVYWVKRAGVLRQVSPHVSVLEHPECSGDTKACTTGQFKINCFQHIRTIRSVGLHSVDDTTETMESISMRGLVSEKTRPADVSSSCLMRLERLVYSSFRSSRYRHVNFPLFSVRSGLDVSICTMTSRISDGVLRT